MQVRFCADPCVRFTGQIGAMEMYPATRWNTTWYGTCRLHQFLLQRHMYFYLDLHLLG